MATYLRQRPPGWFIAVAIILALWGALGCIAFYMHVKLGPSVDPTATDWDRAYYAALPGWFNPVYAAAVFGGLLGSLALLFRSKFALPLFVISLAAVVIQFGYVFFGTDILAHKGAAMTVPFPVFIAAVAVFQIWLARFARHRGWIS